VELAAARWNDVFDEVTFDPRFATFERLEREQTAISMGYRDPFRRFRVAVA